MKLRWFLVPVLFASLLLAPARAIEELRLSISPHEASKELDKASAPMAALLEKKLGVRVRKHFSSDYTGVIEALRARKIDLALLGPLSVVLAEREAQATILVKTAEQNKSFYFGAIISHRDSGLRSLRDLKDHTFAFVDPVSTSGYLFPLWLLQKNGIKEKDFTHRIFAGSHEAVILAVLHRRVDAGAVWTNDAQGKQSSITMTLTKPGDRAQIRILGLTPAIPGPAFVLRPGMDASQATKIRQALLSLNDTPKGREAMRPLGFEQLLPATSADYAVVREAARLRKAIR